MTRNTRWRTRMMWILAGLAVALIIAMGVGVVLQVEDWSRDLTTNFATLDDAHRDPRLRPLLSDRTPQQLADQVAASAEGLPNWEIASRESVEAAIVIRMVRTTRLWRFKDDVVVTIRPHEGGSKLTAESRSRVGRGDLGQNPRNLRELLDKLRDAGA